VGTRTRTQCRSIRTRTRVQIIIIMCRVGLMVAACLFSCEFLLNVHRHLHITLTSKMTLHATPVASSGILVLVAPIVEPIFTSSKSRTTNRCYGMIELTIRTYMSEQ